VPFITIVLDQIAIRVLSRIDAWLGWSCFGLGIHGAAIALQTVITLTHSFIVFTFCSLLVAIQVASGQFTPRIIATTLLRTMWLGTAWACSLFSLLVAVGTLSRPNDLGKAGLPSAIDRCPQR
jgi:hypothetical protein